MNVSKSLLYNDAEITAIGGDNSCVVVRRNVEARPKRRGTKLLIPGRNGAEYIDDDCFDNVTISYALVFTDFAKADAVINYLMSLRGYHRLEDQYDTDIYRMARVQSVNPQTPDREKGYVEVFFECRPEKWLKATVSLTVPDHLSARVINDVSLCREAHLPPDGGTYIFRYNGEKWARNAFFLFPYELRYDGAAIPSDDHLITDLIQVNQGAKIPYRLSCTESTGSLQPPLIAFYRFDKTFSYNDSVPGIAGASYREGVYTVPEPGYIRMCYYLPESNHVYGCIPTNDITQFGIAVDGTPTSGDEIVAEISNPSVFSMIEGAALVSPSRFDAKPWIKVHGRALGNVGTSLILFIKDSGTGGNNYSLDIDSGLDPVDYIIIDSEEEDFSCDVGIDPNTIVSFDQANPGNFPIFSPKGTEFGILPYLLPDARYAYVEVEPRWYRI